MIAVARINNHTPRGEGSGGWRRFMFRRGCGMIVTGRKVSPAGVVCVCVFMFILVRLRMCRCNRNDLPVRPISHLWTVRAARQSGVYLRREGSWRDGGVCRDCVENKKCPFHDFPIQAGKLGGGDRSGVIVAGDLRFPLGEVFAGDSGADAV